jgi:hypothetical protein
MGRRSFRERSDRMMGEEIDALGYSNRMVEITRVC